MEPMNNTNEWEPWAARDEIAPRFTRDPRGGRDGGEALKIECGTAAAFGSYRRSVPVVAGQAYRFRAQFRAEGVAWPQRSVSVRLDWLNEKGERCCPPDFAANGAAGADGWTPAEYAACAPSEARSVRVDLTLGWAEKGAVWWDNLEITEAPPMKARAARVMTLHHRPRNTGSPAESVAEFVRLIENAADQKPDIICLSEGITSVGTGKTYFEVSETLPGPTTETLGKTARKLDCYLVAGIYERVASEGIVFNTAVLIGRDGQLIGAYRKTHLPREEVEGGITPGDEYPVFDTDFGRIGLLICWDTQFPEAARALAVRGAELILVPIWGGSNVLAQARAIENSVYLVTASYDMRSFVVSPAGEILAEATTEKPVAVAAINLARRILQPWLGDMKTRTWKERRPDLAIG